jgi:hypothetical protein
MHVETQRLQVVKAILSKKSNAGGITTSDFKLYYITIKTAWYWHKNRQEDQWIRNRRFRHKPTHLQPADLQQRSPKHTMEKGQPVQQMLLGKLDIHMQKTKTRSLSFTLYQNQLKWIKDLDIRPETLKQLQDAVGNTREQKGIENDFLNRTQKAQHLREAMNKCDCIKLKSFCTAKGTVTDSRDSPQNGRKSLPATHLISDQYPESTGNSKNSASKQSTPQ